MLARDNHDVDDGWLCDKGRFGFQMISSERPPHATRRSAPAARSTTRAGRRRWTGSPPGSAAREGKVAAIVGGSATNEEGYLVQRIVRGALGSADVDSRADRGPSRDLARELSRPRARRGDGRHRQRRTPSSSLDCDPLHEMPILDLRIRKAVRRNGT